MAASCLLQRSIRVTVKNHYILGYFQPRRFLRLRKIWENRMNALPTFISDGSSPRHPGEMKSLEDVFAELNAKNADFRPPVDIGFPLRTTRDNDAFGSRQLHMREKKADRALEKAARNRTLEVPLADIHSEWMNTVGPVHIKEIAEYYGIFNDLFNGAYFFPCVSLDISYEYNEEFTTPVYRGNHVRPSEARTAPEINFKADAESLYTLTLTNPDGHLQDNNCEYLHWFIGNIPGNRVNESEVICDYLQPFPPKGTGFHRLVFVLYKQTKRIDYSSLQRKQPCLSLKDRTFKTYDFYKDRQDVMTPAGLAFFQSEWDDSLHDFFHKTLKMREPEFEYDFPPPYIRPQERPLEKKPFNIYLDKYRDPRDIEKEMLLKRLKVVHPFDGEPPKLKFPHLHKIPKQYPEWLKTEVKLERLRVGKFRSLDVEIFKPERRKRPVFGIFTRESIENRHRKVERKVISE